MLHRIYAPDNREVTDMIKDTHKRLKATCFGYMDDGVGECFDASLVVLRFITATAQDETAHNADGNLSPCIRHAG